MTFFPSVPSVQDVTYRPRFHHSRDLAIPTLSEIP
jgi:hypothetical protein